jgi:hypothetical protein
VSLLTDVPSSSSPDGHYQHHRDLATAVLTTVQTATVTLSSADILALHTTPVTIIPAPGAGKVIAPIRSVVHYSHGTISYTDGDPLYAYIDSPAFVGGGIGVNVSGLTASAFFTDLGGNIAADLSDVENKAVLTSCVTPFAAGDGTVTWTVLYTIEDVPA